MNNSMNDSELKNDEVAKAVASTISLGGRGDLSRSREQLRRSDPGGRSGAVRGQEFGTQPRGRFLVVMTAGGADVPRAVDYFPAIGY
jgi:hypothetical protein